MRHRVVEYMFDSIFVTLRQEIHLCCALTNHERGEPFYYSEELDAKLAKLSRVRSNEIDKYLNVCGKENVGVMKILLLGGPACGKSTIFKQLHIIHKDGFRAPDQLRYYKHLICKNIYQIFYELLNAAIVLDIDLSEVQTVIDDIRKEHDIVTQDYISKMHISKKVAALLEIFWRHPLVQLIYRNRFSITLLDSTKYYLDALDRIGAEDYLPIYDDILHSREPTTELRSESFRYENLKLNIVDVGGQRSQRRKWLHLFDDTTVVLFVVDLPACARKNDQIDAYDIDSTVTIFKEVATNRILKRAIFLLFLNKVDIFEDVVASLDMRQAVKGYGGPNQFNEVLSYVRDRFLEAARPRKSVFPHPTTATNTENIKIVFRACMESVFKASSRATGLT